VSGDGVDDVKLPAGVERWTYELALDAVPDARQHELEDDIGFALIVCETAEELRRYAYDKAVAASRARDDAFALAWSRMWRAVTPDDGYDSDTAS
jgi:hypothetical protein